MSISIDFLFFLADDPWGEVFFLFNNIMRGYKSKQIETHYATAFDTMLAALPAASANISYEVTLTTVLPLHSRNFE